MLFLLKTAVFNSLFASFSQIGSVDKLVRAFTKNKQKGIKMMTASFTMIKRCLVAVAMIVLLNGQSAAGNADFGDKGGVIRFHTTVPGYNVCSAADWERVLDRLEDFIPRSFFAQRVRGLSMGSGRELSSCKTCGSYCYYTGYGCPKLATRRLDEVTGDSNGSPNVVDEPRTLQTTCAADDACCNQLQEFEQKMGELQQQVGSTCAAWVATRDIFCSADTGVCQPTNVDLLGDKVVNQMPTASVTNICKSHDVSFRADTDFFLGRVNFVLRKAGAIVATKKYDQGPFYYFGTTGATGAMATGRFGVGSYTLTVSSDYAPTKTITVPFRVFDC